MEKSDIELVKKFYSELPKKVQIAKEKFNRPLTLAEKILFSHIVAWPSELPKRGVDTLNFLPDRVAMQDATAQMAVLQFMVTGLNTVKVPSTIHCDHLIRAQSGSDKDLLRAIDENQEVYEFLRSAGEKYGIGFWKPGSGIIHQVVLEQYAFPGGMMIGTDSHTPNAGGLGMLAIGVGGSDAVDVMAGQPWGLLNPKLIGVHLKGKLNGWTAAKDVILKVAGELTVKGGTGAIVEYFGEGTNSISCTGKATITNMGAELGATTSVFPFDSRMSDYLKLTERTDVAEWANKASEHLRADAEVLKNPEKYYDRILEIDLSKLEPQWVGPHTPDLLRKASEMRGAVKENSYPENPTAALIGSCTNSSYEDIGRAASVAKQALARGLKPKMKFLVTPGSDQVFQTIKRDGFMDTFNEVGATVLANACGPCIGQWKRDDIADGTVNTIVTSYNRNFRKRNDGNNETLAFIGSLEMVTAVAFAGTIAFNPLVDELTDKDGKKFKFEPPTGDDLPSKGFALSKEGYLAPKSLDERKNLTVAFDPNSDRLAPLEPFESWDGKDWTDLVVLVKAKGKCTTDHISQAGPWLKYRGHLENISKNMYLGAINAFSDEAGKGTNLLTGEKGVSFPDIGKYYRDKKQYWIAVGDENYGEGSSREHAAMEPRFLGCRAVLAKSFARIAETNLKKQGVLPLTFKNPSDYEKITENARYDIVGLTKLAPSSEVILRVKESGNSVDIPLLHSMTDEQIDWFKAGSALNMFGKLAG
jgi:aconitate hydratase